MEIDAVESTGILLDPRETEAKELRQTVDVDQLPTPLADAVATVAWSAIELFDRLRSEGQSIAEQTDLLLQRREDLREMMIDDLGADAADACTKFNPLFDAFNERFNPKKKEEGRGFSAVANGQRRKIRSAIAAGERVLLSQ